jgi:hypothetical protein
VSGPRITIARKTGAAALAKRMAGLTKQAAYVGVPSSTSRDRSDQLLEMAGKAKGKRQKKLEKAAKGDVNNAELLFLFSKGSPLKNQPPRAVVEPAVQAEGNREAIANEIALSAKARLAGNDDEATKRLQRAALAGQNAARKWFTDTRNNWAPNAPSTIAAKGSDRPGIDTGAMRQAIVGIVGED